MHIYLYLHIAQACSGFDHGFTRGPGVAMTLTLPLLLAMVLALTVLLNMPMALAMGMVLGRVSNDCQEIVCSKPKLCALSLVALLFRPLVERKGE